MSQLSLSLLGGFKALLNGEPLTGFRTLKVQALLICLVAEPDKEHRREQLMALLWPGMPEASARANLRQVLFHLRQLVPDFDAGNALVIANRNTLRLNPHAPVTCDVTDFDAFLAAARSHDHVDLLTCRACYHSLQSAVSLYQGSFLEDFYLADSNEFEEWAEISRQGYRRKALDALDTLTTIAVRRAAFVEARAYAERQLDIDNLHESAHQQLMEVLALSGQRSAAVAAYENFRRLLAAELGMAPTSQTTALYEKIRAGELRFDQPQLPGVRGYELKEEIGAGAYGVIHRAVQPAIGREVAVKIIRPRYANDPSFIRRFEVEAQIVAGLEHPHIVPLYDYWRESGGAYQVMRLLRGGNLLTRLQDGPWSPERTAAFLDQIAPALRLAHNQGIVHRDIKPSNILFDEADNAYLADFGIARNLAHEDQLTAAGDIVGTFDYISPEQLQGTATPQSDIYSLGAVLYEMLTGEKPYPDRSLAALIQSHLTGDFPLVSESRPGISPAIDDVIQRATAREPGDRYPAATALAEAFRSALNGRDAATPFVVSLPATTAADADLTNPYKGLRAFQEADARDFFGRESLVARLVSRLADSRFLAVVGPSGSGKSSVVRAGLIPAVRQGAAPGSDQWYIAQMTPGDQPLEELELALWPIAVNPPPSLVEPMQRDSRGMLRTIRRVLPDEAGVQLLLVIDQFEELFTMADEERRNHFLESLYVAISAPRSPLRVVITLRADFYDRPLQFQPLAGLFQEHTELILPLDSDELTWAVQEPARRLGVAFEAALLPAIVADVTAQPGALPLLQYALTELFDARVKRTMTREAYAKIGGVPGALARRADEVFHALSVGQQALVRRLLLQLVTLGEGVEDTRRRVRLSDLRQIAPPAGQDGNPLADVLDQLGAARLLTFDRDPLTREPTVEVAHEALLTRWERLRGWLAESRNDLRLERQLAAAADDWQANGHDDSYLLHGARLAQFEAWQPQSTLALLPREAVYLQASQAAHLARQTEEAERRRLELETAQQLAAAETLRAEEQTRAARLLRRRAVWLAGALALAAGLALIALLFGQQAQRNAAVAERSAAEAQSIALAAGAQAAQADANGDLALGLALAANELESPPAFARRVLYDVALAPGPARRIISDGGWRWSMEVSPDGRRVASGDDLGEVTVWDITTGEELLHLAGEHDDSIGDVAFSPDGRFLLTSSYDDQIILWDAATGAVIWRARNPTGDPNTLDVSPDGAMAASGTEGGVVTLWDMANGESLGELAGHDPAYQVLPVAFSPDGRWLAGGSENGEVIIWDVAARSVSRRIETFGDALFSLAFSPDGKTLAAAGKSNAILLLDTAAGEQVGELPRLPEWVFDLEFNADGSQLLAASRDGAVMRWDVAGQRLLQSFYGEPGFALNVAFLDPDTAVASYNNGNLRVWDMADGRQVQRLAAGDFMASYAQSGDGRLAAAGLNNGVRLVDLDSGEVVGELSLGEESGEEDDNVTALAFDEAGDRLLTGSGDGRLYLWDTGRGEIVREFAGHEGFIHELRFSPDGRTFLSTADDGQVILWTLENGEPLFTYRNPTDPATALAFSPDGRRIAVGLGTTRYVAVFGPTEQRDNRVLLLDAATGDTVGQLAGHTGPVTAVAFSPDGRYLLSGGQDSTLRLWDLESEEEVRRFDGHAGGVTALEFSDDGVYAASGAQDGALIIWEVGSGDLLRQIQAHAGVIHFVEFVDGEGALRSAAEDGQIALWNLAPDAEILRQWIAANRYTLPLECRQRLQYGLVDECPPVE